MDAVTWREMGLTDTEYAKVCEALGRDPNMTELGMFAVMWSEHCGYKYSRPVLALFKAYREAQQQGALENAGIIPLDDKLGLAFKIESHNHPSAVEPFQGAATGVGGILRDIFTMGARPIAILNSLRFGPLVDDPAAERNRYLLEHVVDGIQHYGNCVGVPTVAGEICFHSGYSGNPLVNAMAVGVVPLDRIASSKAAGIGNPVIYVGSATGKDGIHGATFASVELGPDSEAKRPNVQMGDPFQEKLLIEATLEALATGSVVGIQDMGAAGLTCSTCEMSSRGGVGMEIDVALVPLRELDMSPYEIMLSESQERMLLVASKGDEERILEVFHRWGLPAAVIGAVTNGGLVRVLHRGVLAAEVPAAALTDGCPTYFLEGFEDPAVTAARELDISGIPEPENYSAALISLLGRHTIASKAWVTGQYDSTVQTQTVLGPGTADAAVLRIRGSKKGVALKTDGNSRYCALDPFVGGQIAVVEAARNVACTGAAPAGLTDGLNFGNPVKPEAFYQFKRAVEGIASAADALGIPVVSGNVSFYNETPSGAIQPTPIIGMVGLLHDPRVAVGSAFAEEGDALVLLQAYTDPSGGIGASEYLAAIHGLEAGAPPVVDLQGEKRLHHCVVSAIVERLVRSAHDVSDGGLAVCLAESAIAGAIGASILLKPMESNQISISARLFGEAQGRVVVSLKGERGLQSLERFASEMGIEAVWIGTVGGDSLRISVGPRILVDCKVEALANTYNGALPGVMVRAAH